MKYYCVETVCTKIELILFSVQNPNKMPRNHFISTFIKQKIFALLFDILLSRKVLIYIKWNTSQSIHSLIFIHKMNKKMSELTNSYSNYYKKEYKIQEYAMMVDNKIYNNHPLRRSIEKVVNHGQKGTTS